MTPSLNLEPFAEADLEAATDLFVHVFGADPWNENWPRASAHRRLSAIVHAPGFLGVSALHNTQLIGFALGHLEPYRDEDHYYLQEMCVATDRQRTGVGKAILAYLESLLWRGGCSQMYLLTARESPAAAFYHQNGFTSAQRTIVMVRRGVESDGE